MVKSGAERFGFGYGYGNSLLIFLQMKLQTQMSRPFKIGSKRHIRSLKKCKSQPTSQTCRKHVTIQKES